MLLKKQTVWLLTMLSLVVVLSVYYVTSDPSGSNIATIGKEDASEANSKTSAEDQDMNIITEAAGDEVFETARLDLQDKRSKEVEDLTVQMSSAELSADEKEELYAEMQEIKEYGVKENTLESVIKGLGYEDALVRADGSEVKVTVKTADEHSRAEAAKILNVVREEIGTEIVATVQFDKVK
ncbi:SpoIIIAH-like family protein [Lederbergia lenta]|uniref:SpoIIIAH n=1 Tax=Lederbergia lenta TaxID=1467 RepID=A0A2X4WF06_LEDLE|nr:SpoIIIAH-like family protein [Lederbergia lenta]MCM3111472.1 SpoIIIAH-like family protein [Lederbergia lenta]MEC2325141.1 SpoIIIAH-like family protein [Lederbergia lenta]SQI56220.1 SpoIIIAH [Lederbergia lenta]